MVYLKASQQVVGTRWPGKIDDVRACCNAQNKREKQMQGAFCSR